MFSIKNQNCGTSVTMSDIALPMASSRLDKLHEQTVCPMDYASGRLKILTCCLGVFAETSDGNSGIHTRSITLRGTVAKPEVENTGVHSVSATKLLGTFATEREMAGM